MDCWGLTEGLRQLVAKIWVAAEALAMNGDMPETSRRLIQIIETEVGDLSETLDGLAKEYRNVIAGHGRWRTSIRQSAALRVRRLRRENIDPTGVPDCSMGIVILNELLLSIHRPRALDI